MTDHPTPAPGMGDPKLCSLRAGGHRFGPRLESERARFCECGASISDNGGFHDPNIAKEAPAPRKELRGYAMLMNRYDALRAVDAWDKAPAGGGETLPTDEGERRMRDADEGRKGMQDEMGTQL